MIQLAANQAFPLLMVAELSKWQIVLKNYIQELSPFEDKGPWFSLK